MLCSVNGAEHGPLFIFLQCRKEIQCSCYCWFSKSRFQIWKNPLLGGMLLGVKCNLSDSLFKAEVPMDLKLDRKIPAGISDKKRCKVFILRGLRIQCTVRVCANSTLLEGLYLDHIPYRISAFVEELHWGHGCRQPPPPSQLSKNRCFFIYQLVGFLVRFQVQKRFCC